MYTLMHLRVSVCLSVYMILCVCSHVGDQPEEGKAEDTSRIVFTNVSMKLVIRKVQNLHPELPPVVWVQNFVGLKFCIFAETALLLNFRSF